jgi:lipopolysaccharide assembly outer membrane protein LptD (OstA)
MTKLSAIVLTAFLCAVISPAVRAQEQPTLVMQTLKSVLTNVPDGWLEYDGATGMVHGTNGVFLQYGGATLMADCADMNPQTHEVIATGHVRIESGAMVWVGDQIHYNFDTHQMQSEQFRTGKPPAFAAGEELQGDKDKKIFTARHAYVTTDDVSNPEFRVRASKITIVPGKYIEMWNAVMFMDGVPVFYFPYYQRELGPHANNFNFLPGYRSTYGAFLLSTYTFYLGDAVDGKIHVDYREKRGLGTGPDLNLHLGRWGDAEFRYYYLDDRKPTTSTNGTPWVNGIPNNRQVFHLGYQATPATNLNVKALVNYQSDPLVVHDFFTGDYRNNPQPNTFVEINKYSDNWSLDAEATPQLNNFFDQVERLPDVKLTGYRQQVFNTPLYYDSESSAGYYRKYFADTNGPTPPAYSASRADTFHQLLLPKTFFGWLNITPRAGGRFTYYSSETGPGGTNAEAYRGVFNTGVETSFKTSQLWTGATNSLLAIDGLRHIVEPSVTYAYVPEPNKTPSQLPQFDTELPCPVLLPVTFPDYNNIDSIDTENVLRFGLRNTLQTKREGQLENLLNWNLLMDWRLKPDPGQNTLGDLYSELGFRPRTWLLLQSQFRFDINQEELNMAFHQLTFAPNEKWSWGLGHWFLRDGFLDSGSDLLTSTMFYRVNDNWGARLTHYYNFDTGRLQEQMYTLYRDMRSWTGALTLRLMDNGNGPTDVTVAFTFSLKAAPRNHLGDDTVQPYHLVGE